MGATVNITIKADAHQVRRWNVEEVMQALDTAGMTHIKARHMMDYRGKILFSVHWKNSRNEEYIARENDVIIIVANNAFVVSDDTARSLL